MDKIKTNSNFADGRKYQIVTRSQPTCEIAPKNAIGKKAIEGSIRDALTSYFHPVGPCKMSVGSNAVVDDQLKVCGFTGLRVRAADASVMPTVILVSANASTIMMGEVVS